MRFALALLALPTLARADDTYQVPPKPVARFVEAPPIPSPSLSPDQHTLALLTPRLFPSIAEVSEPELRLAGIRISPRTGAASRRGSLDKLELLDIAGGSPRAIAGIPKDARIAGTSWSPDGKHLAFTITGADAVALWVADVATAQARQLAPSVNGAFGRSCTWLPDSAGLVCRTAIGGKPPAPAPATPTGPIIQENTGTKKPTRTNPDLLTSPADEKLFEHYMTSQIAIVGVDGKIAPLGKPGLYLAAEPSPDGKHLVVEALHRPFSYRVALGRFPVRTEVWSRAGAVEKMIADLPLAEDVPVDFDAVRTGRRDIAWRGDAAATLCWVEAQDGGDPKKAVAVHDRVDCWAAPFAGAPRMLAELSLRFGGIQWGTGQLALVEESWWKDRKTRTHVVAPDDPKVHRVLWDRSSEDRYSDPGRPVQRRLANGFWTLRTTAHGDLLLEGEGASDQGDRPFLDHLDVATGKTERIWRSDGERFAHVLDVLDDERVILSRETVTEPPQLYVVSFTDKTERQLTHVAHPVPELAKVKKELIKWKRKDGLQMSAMLYLPPGFTPKKDRPLPVLVWVYPQEFKSSDAAGQVTDSPYRFAYPWWGGPLFALTQGFAVVDNPTFAIVGEGKAEPNDNYVEQLTADAQAMVDAVVAMGVGDRDRFAVGGHSYGAFTTANLLAHTDLFRAGIARSGAYNRTLTPFGFQSEERTYWQAADIYDRMSPFRFANKIDEPLLLIHGMADDNAGTYPIQSERLFAAMQGLGGRVRYVQLPAEAHGYRARESALHVLWEQVRWLDLHVKNAKKR
jgi:dipeptidyl aminopeptidase/acylaminoacyl peptidase